MASKDHSQESKISFIFNSLLTVMKICGVLHLDRKRHTKAFIPHLLYCCLILMIGTVGALKLFTAFLNGTKTGKFRYHIMTLANCWLFCVVLYLSLACLVGTKHISKIQNSFDQYEQTYGIHFNKRKYKRIFDVLTLGLCILMIFVQISFCFAFGLRYFSPTSWVYVYLWPLEDTTGNDYTFAIVLYSVTVFPIQTNYNIIFMLYFFVLACVQKEFDNVIKRMEELTDDDKVKANFENIRQQHQAIINILSFANPILRHVAGCFYAMGIPVICFMIFGVSSGTMAWEDIYNSIGNVIGNLVFMFALTFSGAKVSSKAHQPLEQLNNIKLSTLPTNVMGQIVVFSNRLSGPTIGVSVYGLFVVDYSAVLLVFGTLITYAVIAIQFTSPIPYNCGLLTLNMTNISSESTLQ